MNWQSAFWGRHAGNVLMIVLIGAAMGGAFGLIIGELIVRVLAKGA